MYLVAGDDISAIRKWSPTPIQFSGSSFPFSFFLVLLLLSYMYNMHCVTIVELRYILDLICSEKENICHIL
jgi:hypothetical protein